MALVVFDDRHLSAEADGGRESGECKVDRSGQGGQDEKSRFLLHEVELHAGNRIAENEDKRILYVKAI